MKLSILLPTHNRPDVLPYAIESVLAQSFADFELLICGDGCTDSTAEVVSRYAAGDSRVRWFDLSKAPGFGYANRNLVLHEARGELIGFMAHDDLVTSDHFSLLVQAMEDPGAHLAYTEAAWVGRDGVMVPAVYHLEDKTMREEYFAGRWNRLPSTCIVHRRGAFDTVGWWNADMPRGGDMDLWARIIRAYGADATRSVTVMTCLHFRALWRLDELAPDTEPVWKQLHEEPGRLSDAMRWPVPSGMVEQAACWGHLNAEPESVPRLRDACRHALITYAWHLEQQLSVQQGLAPVAELDRKIQTLREQKTALQSKLSERDAKLKRMKEELDLLKQENKGSKWLGWLRRR
jgi:hypothetical protein